MTNKCENCAEKCPQAERANQAALGRMYATKEFIALLKKVESGELVEVVRCKDCRFCERDHTLDGGGDEYYYCWHVVMEHGLARPNEFCCYGERKDND